MVSIRNWATLSPAEQERTRRIITKRNARRLAVLREAEQGDGTSSKEETDTRREL